FQVVFGRVAYAGRQEFAPGLGPALVEQAGLAQGGRHMVPERAGRGTGRLTGCMQGKGLNDAEYEHGLTGRRAVGMSEQLRPGWQESLGGGKGRLHATVYSSEFRMSAGLLMPVDSWSAGGAVGKVPM